MAKAQKRSSREVRKPKAVKVKPAASGSALAGTPVSALIQKPKSTH